MIDSLRLFLPVAQKSSIGRELGLVEHQTWRRFAVLTLHVRQRRFGRQTTKLMSAIDAVASEVPVIFPVHPRTKQRLAEAGAIHNPQLRLIDHVGYLDFLCLLSQAALVLTDSGGIQEETTRAGYTLPHPP